MSKSNSPTLKQLFKQNREWSENTTSSDPDFFVNLSKQQTPDYLWIGCADSRVPSNQLLGLQPGEVFVHRNIANVVVHTDLNCLSVIQFAVEVLKVKHIIVCGHYGCGGVKAALEGNQFGLIDNWLMHIKDVYRLHQNKIDQAATEDEKLNLLCEQNVIEQVANVCHTSIIQNQWQQKRDLTVHGLIYSLKKGLLKDLGVSFNKTEQLARTHILKTS